VGVEMSDRGARRSGLESRVHIEENKGLDSLDDTFKLLYILYYYCINSFQ